MITQAVVDNGDGTESVLWLSHENRDGVFCETGSLIRFEQEGRVRSGYVKRSLGGYADNVSLPPNARQGTIVAVI